MSYSIQKNNSERYDWFCHLLLSISDMQLHCNCIEKSLQLCLKWSDSLFRWSYEVVRVFLVLLYHVSTVVTCFCLFLLVFGNIQCLLTSRHLPRPGQAMTSQAVYIIKIGCNFATKRFSKLKLVVSETLLQKLYLVHTLVDRRHHCHNHFWSLLSFLKTSIDRCEILIIRMLWNTHNQIKTLYAQSHHCIHTERRQYNGDTVLRELKLILR